MCVSDCNTVWVLCFEVEFCPETGNSHIDVIKNMAVRIVSNEINHFCKQ